MTSREDCTLEPSEKCPFKHCIPECQHHTNNNKEPEPETETQTRTVETIETRYPVYDDWWNGPLPVKVTKTIQGGE